MDPTNIVALAFVAVAVWLVSRPLLESVGGTGDFLAQLFVPPDRSLGWPRGVQESDAPWGWHAPSTVIDRDDADPDDGAGASWLDLDDLRIVVRTGSFIVPVQPVLLHRGH